MDNLGFGNFYPYIPNEVKHRKRTTSSQLKVLETMFKTDTKPNATLRKKLAQELEMTPRGVQVWFQNRRAKEKNKANKAEAVKRSQPTGESVTTADKPVTQESSLESPTDTPALAANVDEPAPPMSKQASPPPVPANVSPSPSNTSDSARSCRSDLYAARRGSLPVNLYLQPHSDYASEYARRCSVDTSLQMLARNPYAPLAVSRSSPLIGQPISQHVSQLGSRRAHQRGLESHSSMDGHMLYYPDSGDSSNASTSSSPHSPFTSPAALPDPAFYAPSRIVPPLIPGPLPSPDFSFGAASTCSPPSADRESPDAPLGHAPYMLMREDFDDDSSSSYDAYSRFGSLTSIATSESSLYYSECGEDAFQSRRGSTTSGINDMMSTMNFHTSPVPLSHEEIGTTDNQSQNGSGSDRTTTYPSPAPTVSPPAASPHAPEVDSNLRYPSVDLGFMHHAQLDGSVSQHEPVPVSIHHGDEVAPYSFGGDHGVYTHHSNSSSSLELFTSEYQPDLPDGPSISATGHYIYPSSFNNGAFLTGPDVQAEYGQTYPGYTGAVDSFPKYA